MRSYSVDKPIIIKAHAVKYFTNLASHQPRQNRTIHRELPSPLPFNERFAGFAKCSKSPSPLPPLEKGEVLSPDKIRATPGGIASPLSLACTNPPKPALSPRFPYCNRLYALICFRIRTIPQKALYPCLPCQREVD